MPVEVPLALRLNCSRLNYIPWKRGRVVDCTGLENRRWETIREFESHRFRQTISHRQLVLSVAFLCPFVASWAGNP